MICFQDPEGSGGHCGVPLQAGHPEHEGEPWRGEAEREPGPAGGGLHGGPRARQEAVCRGHEEAGRRHPAARQVSQPGAQAIRLQQQQLSDHAQKHGHQVR